MRRYISIQYLRAGAALLVVFHHSRNPEPWLYSPLPHFISGQAGVDIFFVISGFIMFSAARAEAPPEFIRRRFIRIAPLYWVATIFTFVFFSFKNLPDAINLHFLDILQSISFIPHYNISLDHIWPYLVPGWTLDFEVFFYFLFFIGLLLNKVVPTLSISIIVLLLLGLMLKSHSAVFLTYTDPLLMEFLVGVLLARFQDKILPPVSIALLPIGLVALMLSGLLNGPRVLIWGAPALGIVAGTLALERSGFLPNWRRLKELGDGSYAIYLFQVLSIAAVSAIVKRLPITGLPQFSLFVAASMSTSIIFGMIIHYKVENYLMKTLSRRRSK